MKAECKMSFEVEGKGNNSSMNWGLQGKRQEAINNEIILRGMKSFDGLDLEAIKREEKLDMPSLVAQLVKNLPATWETWV